MEIAVIEPRKSAIPQRYK